MEEDMPTFILTINGTDQGIRAVRDAPKRSQAARELAKKVGVEIKEIYLTSGEHDLLVIAEAPHGDHVTKFALAAGSLGNERTPTARAWTAPVRSKRMSELPSRLRVADRHGRGPGRRRRRLDASGRGNARRAG